MRLATPGFERPNVFALRSLADARAIIAATAGARSVVLVGAGFISLEAAGALRTRGLEVHVVAREPVPMERVFGREIGGFLTGLHEAHGVVFHLQAAATDFDGQVLTLDDGTRIPADLLIVGVGVAPRTELAGAAGLAVQGGILVDEHLRTSVADVYAAGDVARYRRGAEHVRIEHWVHAQRQGQVAAANLLGAGQAFDDVPFFWTHHYGLDLRYTGHADGWDEIRLDGDLVRARLHGALLPRRQTARGRLDRPRSREPRDRGAVAAVIDRGDGVGRLALAAGRAGNAQGYAGRRARGRRARCRRACDANRQARSCGNASADRTTRP